MWQIGGAVGQREHQPRHVGATDGGDIAVHEVSPAGDPGELIVAELDDVLDPVACPRIGVRGECLRHRRQVLVVRLGADRMRGVNSRFESARPDYLGDDHWACVEREAGRLRGPGPVVSRALVTLCQVGKAFCVVLRIYMGLLRSWPSPMTPEQNKPSSVANERFGDAGSMEWAPATGILYPSSRRTRQEKAKCDVSKEAAMGGQIIPWLSSDTQAGLRRGWQPRPR